MTEINEIYIVKHNDDIIGTTKQFLEAKITLVDEIVYDSCNSDKAYKINDEYDGIEIYGTWYSAYDILDSLGDVDEVYRSIVESSVDCMSYMDVGLYEEYEMDDDYSISCGLEITDDDGVVHIIDDEDLSNLDNDVLEARQTLIEHNLRLVVYIAKKFDNTGVGVEDLISIGTIGLIKAINTFKADKNIKLATYASRCIENEILMHLRRNSRIKTEVSIDEPLNVDWDGNELLLSDILGTEEDLVYKDIEDEVDLNLLEQAMDILSDRERTIIELRYGIGHDDEEMTQKEVADLLGISQSYISRLEKKIIRRLRKEMLRLG